MKKNYKYILLFLLCAGLGFFFSCGRKDKSQDIQQVRDIDVAEVTVDSVVLHKTYPGYLSSGSSVDVTAQVDGILLKKYYDAGGMVKKGQILFQVDPTLYQDAVQRAEAALTSAISQRDYAKTRYAAVQKAFEAEAVSKMEVLSAESNLRQAEANIKDCQASLHTAQTNLGYCTMRATMNGNITDATIGEGNYVNGADDPIVLAKIFDNSTMSAAFEIEDAQYERMVGRTTGINDPIYNAIPLKFRDNLLHDYTGKLSYEAPDVNVKTGTILLKCDIKNPYNELKEGMYVTINLPYGVDPKAVLVKDASIGTDQLGKYVYVVNDSNKVVYTPIKVGEVYHDSLRIVESGLKPGDRYVTKALLTVRNGETVNPKLIKP
ncbi:MAG: efflux RND transporter periplasmic adaptor subunit [Muribaculaceae bacterium]|nr:efflux RND transporter periplasmic adaptor subunit [Muribaculaceae bacterium]